MWSGKCPVGEMSVRGNILVGKCPVAEVSFGELSGRGIVHRGRFCRGSVSLGIVLGEVSVGELSSRGTVRILIMINPIMFADDTNLFYEHKNSIKLSAKVNEELINTNDWSMANKLSLNVRKTKYSLFHKPSRVDDLPLQLPKLSINNQEIKRTSYTKFLGVILDENLSWKEHLKYPENKTAKSIGLCTKLNLSYIKILCCRCIFLTFIHT